MNAPARIHLRELDAALLAIADARARFLAEHDPDGLYTGQGASSDLLRRYDGPLDAGGVRGLFTALDAACAAARREGGPA